MTIQLGYGGRQIGMRHSCTRNQRSPSRYKPHQGPRECARRRYQMGTGEFAPGNGLNCEEALALKRQLLA